VLSVELDDHALITDPSNKSEINAIVKRNCDARHTMPLMEDSRLSFRDTANGRGESSRSDENLDEMLPVSPDLAIRMPQNADRSSEDEGGVPGDIDSTDDS
jgi:hypothetical protein